MLIFVFFGVLYFVDGYVYDGFNYGEEFFYVFKVVLLKVISFFWSYNRSYKYKIVGMLVWSVLCFRGNFDGIWFIFFRKDIF